MTELPNDTFEAFVRMYPLTDPKHLECISSQHSLDALVKAVAQFWREKRAIYSDWLYTDACEVTVNDVSKPDLLAQFNADVRIWLNYEAANDPYDQRDGYPRYGSRHA